MNDALRKEYIVLFNGITEVTNELENLIQRLKLLQQAAENCYLDGCDTASVEPKKEKEVELVLTVANDM